MSQFDNLVTRGGLRRTRLEFPPLQIFDHKDWGGGYNTRDDDINVADNELTGGQNIDLSPDKAMSKRLGHTVYGSFSGGTTGILGLVVHEPQGGTMEFLRGYDTTIERYVAGTWTALTGVTMTTNKSIDSAYFPLTSKTYIVNQTDQVVKYTSGASGDQSDSSFKKGKYIVQYKNRLLVANVTGQEDYIWYTDLGVDTFSSNNYLRTLGEITGMIVFYDKWLTFTKRKIFICQNFGFNGTASGPESFIPMPTNFGAIYERTIAKVGNLAFFLGQSAEGIAAVYATEGVHVTEISAKIRPDLNAVAPAQLASACATQWGRFYRLSVAASGQTTNTLEYIYDTTEHRWLPPYTNGLGGFSCYAAIETSSEVDLYAGVQGGGHVYKLNQVDYDEESNEKYATAGSYDGPIDANPAKRIAQSFKLSSYTTLDTVTITQVALRLKKNTGTTTDLQVRIETNNNGKPSGTAVAHGTATISAFSSTTYAYKTVTFSNCSLTGNTTYWLVIKHVTEGSGTSQYYWGGNGSSPTYANGNSANYVQGVTASTDTYAPQASPASTACDGVAFFDDGGEHTFASMRSQTSGIFGDNQSTMIPNLISEGAVSTNDYTELSRGIVLFDTSSIPDDAVITSVDLNVYVRYTTNDFGQALGVTAVTPASNTGLANSDYNIANYGSTRFTSDINLSSLTVNAYNTLSFNASGKAAINVTGISKFALRLSSDIDNSAPTWIANAASAVIISTADSLIQPPQLVVSYTTAAGTAVWTSDAAKDQNFVVYDEGVIDGYGISKAFYFAPQGQKSHLRDIFVTADAPGNWNMEVGVNGGTYSSFDTVEMNLGANTDLIGSTFRIGTSALGAPSRSEQRLRFSGYRTRTAKFRFRNAHANQPFKVYGFRTRHQVIQKLK